MKIKETLNEWKNAPKYSEIRGDLLSGKTPQELVKIRSKCIESRKFQRYGRFWMGGFLCAVICIVSIVQSVIEDDLAYLFLSLFGLLFWGMVLVVDDGPQEAFIRSIDEELRKKWED